MIIKWQSRNITMHKFITPRVGSDVTLIILTLITTNFHSTLPVWGATPMQIPLPVRPIDFNPRSPCGERQLPALQRGTDGHFNPRSPCGERHFNDVYSVLLDDISIHAPRVGSDLTNGVSAMSTPLFQSTLPVWGATGFYGRRFFPDGISIHAPRVGSDQPEVERRRTRRAFQSTLPVWGATSTGTTASA